MSLIDKLKTDLASFNYKKVEKSRKEPSNVSNLPTTPTRVNEVTTTIISSNFSKLATMDRGSNDVKQPSDFYLNMHRFNDGFGNIGLQVIKTVEDVERWAKWSITPKGLLFNIKQGVLQRFNARRETRIYNPLGLFASIPPYIHAPRHWGRKKPTTQQYEENRSGNFSFLSNPPKYPDDVGIFKKSSKRDENLHRDRTQGDGPGRVMRNTKVGTLPDNKAEDGTNFIDGRDIGLGRTYLKANDKSTLYAVGTSNQLQVPYHGKKNVNEVATLPKDFIKFRIRDLVNGKWLIFPAHLGSITDTVTPSYSSERYIGRPDSVHVYTGTDRTIGFDFKVAAFTKQEIPIIQEKMNYLVGLGYPTFKQQFDEDKEHRPVAPFISLTMGDLFKDTPGYFSGITVTIEEGATWELDDGFQIPQFFSVSCEFVYIGKYLTQTLGKHYEVPWLNDGGARKKYTGTFKSDSKMEMFRPNPNAGAPFSELIDNKAKTYPGAPSEKAASE